MSETSPHCAYTVAFHQRDCVKTISCSEYGIAQEVYDNISQQWAKIILDRQNREVVARYGGNRWSKQCEEEVQRLPAFDDTAPLQIAPYVVAFHQRDCIRMIGLYTSESARAVYDAVSKDWAKVVSDRKHSQVLASYGSTYYVKLCKDRISQLDAFNGNVPLQRASYVVALHQSDRVRMIGFSSEGPARAVYNAIPNDWAKILMDRRRSQDMLSYGGGCWITQCKEEVLRLPLLAEPISPSPSGPYVVAFHQNDCVRMIGLSIEGSARAVYDAISTEWAKNLMDTRGYELLASYGSSYFTKQCEEEARGLDALQSTTSLKTASYIVAFHQNGRVRMLGFSEERAACAVFGAVSDEWAKVLMNRRHSEPLASYGSTCYVRQEYTVEAITNQTGVVEVAAAQRFEVAPPSQNDSSDNGTAPSSNHKASIIIGAVIGSLVFLLLLGGGAFLFIVRQRKRRNLKHRLSLNAKIQPELDLHSPPAGNKNSETVSPMLEDEMTPNLADMSPDTVEQSPEGTSAEDERERRNSFETQLHVETSEPKSAQQQEGPHAVLDDVAAEVLRLRVQVQQLIEREVERIQGNVFEPPPAYV
ncbi:hypothetical protein EV421DRAFT_2038952 [Armillaria borealis]|uniref:Uncharacterized protein n=1 Tax=Armillaria borealis TaxID=47425 RepID=A0AA39J4B9_9AGAR|nr:hypothetical protein EV421DRAFT_2038952 [Armillaria borealis]